MTSTVVADPRAQRALRLACGTGLSLAASFGLALPLPFIAPMLAVFVLAAMNQPLPLTAAISLLLALALATGSGLLLTPFLRYASFTGLLLIGLSGGFTQKIRFAAADASPTFYQGKAISLFLAGRIVPAIVGPQLAVWRKAWMEPVTLAGAFTIGIANKFLEPLTGAVLGKILVLIFIILFIQKRPRGLFAVRGRAVES